MKNKYITKSLSTGEVITNTFNLSRYTTIADKWIAVLSIGLLSFSYFKNRSIEMCLTNKRIVLKTGVFNRKTEELRLRKIETVEIRQGFFDRMINRGSVKITGSGGSSVILANVDSPLLVKSAIDDAVDPLEA